MSSGVNEQLLQRLMKNRQLHMQPHTSISKYLLTFAAPARWANLWQLIIPFYRNTDPNTAFFNVMGNSLKLSAIHFPVNVSSGAHVTPTEDLALTCIKTEAFLLLK